MSCVSIVTMFSVFLIFAVATTVLAGGGDNECKKLLRMDVLKCCKEAPALLGNDEIEDLKACKDIMKPPPNCDADICLAKRRGFAGTEDGTFDTKVLESHLNKTFEKKSELAELIVKDCVRGDLSDFGPPDVCDLIKFRHCLQIRLVMDCPDWDSAGSCAATKELVEKCKE